MKVIENKINRVNQLIGAIWGIKKNINLLMILAWQSNVICLTNFLTCFSLKVFANLLLCGLRDQYLLFSHLMNTLNLINYLRFI